MSSQRTRPCAGLYDALGDGVLSAGMDAKIIDINERFSGLVGADRNHLKGSSSASVIRLAFGLSDKQWADLEQGHAQRVRAYQTARQEHELLRLEQPGANDEPAQVVYVVRDVGYRQQRDGGEGVVATSCVPDRMLRQIYEWVARCWADGRPFSLLGIHSGAQGMPEPVLSEVLSWAGEESCVGALPASMFDTLVGKVPRAGRCEQWRWVTLPGVTGEVCRDWLARVWRPGLRERCFETEIYGAYLAELEDAQLPRVESWVVQALLRVVEQLEAPYRARVS